MDALAPVRAVLHAPGVDQVQAREDQPARYAHSKRAGEFLLALSGAAQGVVLTAATLSGYPARTAYDLRARDGQFKADWDAAVALSTDALVAEAITRATIGRPHTYTDKHGNVHVDHKVSDLLLMFLIKARRPSEYRDNATIRHEFEGPMMVAGPRALPPPPHVRVEPQSDGGGC